MSLTSEAWCVLIVDDHPLVRDGLRAALQRVLPQASVAEAGSGADAMKKLAELHPRLILLDVNLPDTNGLVLAVQIRALDKRAKVLLVAAEADPWTVQAALEAGASGFMAKTNAAGCLAQAVQTILGGKEFLCADSTAALQRAVAHGGLIGELPGPAVLSRREREILRYLAHGENTKQIAALLEISPKTVETHRQHILRKLGTNSVAALTRYAIRHGLLAV
jgi:DNA-binding NarL/FixJ family response regulator